MTIYPTVADRGAEMAANVTVHQATLEDAESVAWMVEELLTEIMQAGDTGEFFVDPDDLFRRLKALIADGTYIVFIAQDDLRNSLGFIATYECHTLYAGGKFGTISEFYVRPAFRSRNVGSHLLSIAQAFGKSRNWRRMEVMTPPLPQFARTCKFYMNEGFTITGGRKLKMLL